MNGFFAGRAPQRLVVDSAACDGHGICVLRCPERLGLDAFGYVGVDDDSPLVGRELRRARSAVAACPERALRLVAVTGADRGSRPGSVPGARPRPVERADSTLWLYESPR